MTFTRLQNIYKIISNTKEYLKGQLDKTNK